MKSTNRRGHTLAPIVCLAVLTGCVATKQDVRVLRQDITALQMRQDSLYRESARRMSAQADSVRGLTELLRATRGQLANQLRQLQEMVVTLQELSGQSAQSVRQLQERIQQQAMPPAPAAPAAQQDTTDPEELYRLATTKLQEKSPATARAAFQQYLTQYPQAEHAADAQFGIGESYVQEEALADAVASFAAVAEAYPNSPRAPE
ncbi:MAG TPA: outer membrane protein assembly factor BamD, partial [Longimicrobiales bacterium]